MTERGLTVNTLQSESTAFLGALWAQQRAEESCLLTANSRYDMLVFVGSEKQYMCTIQTETSNV